MGKRLFVFMSLFLLCIATDRDNDTMFCVKFMGGLKHPNLLLLDYMYYTLNPFSSNNFKHYTFCNTLFIPTHTVCCEKT